MPDISVIICSYNPDSIVFSEVLESVSKLNSSGIHIELIIVDNNSSPPISETFSESINQIPFPVKLFVQRKAGLLHARKMGFENSGGDYIVFFDDDNLPDKEYLLAVFKAFQEFPNVGVWGPGQIKVTFTGNPPAWIHHYKAYFQERNFENPRYACVNDWLSFSPPGTGQAIRRSIFSSYLEEVKAGKLSAIGRSGKSMTSSEDVQLVFEAVKRNFAGGVFPEMKLVHVIAERKTSLQYLRKLQFGMANSFPEAYTECFPFHRNVMPCFNNWQIFVNFLDIAWVNLIRKRSPKLFSILFCENLGRMHGCNQTRGFNTDSFWFNLIHLLKLN